MGRRPMFNMFEALTVLLSCLALCAGASSATPATISVYYDATTEVYSTKLGLLDPAAAATGAFDAEALNGTGWAKLQIQTKGSLRSNYFAAGFAEGALTCKFVAAVAQNNDDPDQGALVTEFAQQAEDWTRSQAAAHPDVDVWRTVGEVLAQFDGIVAGYNQSDIFFGHATWDIFNNAAPRIFKTYTLPVTRAGVAEMRTVHFSSTGPWLSSVDDFYTVGSGSTNMAVMETSNTVLNTELYKQVVPQSLLCWVRAVVANRLATDGASWAELFSTHHSGSYTNQWQVIDLSKFSPGQPARAGLLTILEEIPGLIHFEDMTSHLSNATVLHIHPLALLSPNVACSTGLAITCPTSTTFGPKMATPKVLGALPRALSCLECCTPVWTRCRACST